MTLPGPYQPSVERACSTEPGSEESRTAACDEITNAINEQKLAVLDLAVLLGVPLTSPEKEARENGTRLLGEVVSRCRGVLGEGELHTLAEFLAARLRDWPCVGAAAVACRALLQSSPPAGGGAGAGAGAGPGPGGGLLRDDSAALVLEAAAEMLRSAQSFRQDDRSALLQLLLAAAGGWGAVAAARGIELLDAFLGAADGEKDPRCLLLAFEAVRELCGVYHKPGVEPAPLRQLADEVADWASSYFPVSFNPPPSLARGAAAITRADLAGALEGALAASPFLAGGVLPLLVEKLSSTYRPAKEDSISALRRCCPAYGPDALAPHVGQLWPALRGEVLAPSGHGGGVPAAAAGGPGGEADARLSLAASASACLTVAVRAAGPGVMDEMALQDASVGDLLSIVRGAGSPTRGSAPQAAARADSQVQCGSMLLAAVCAAVPASLHRAHTAVLAQLQTALAESLAAADVYDRNDQTLYGMTVLAAVVDAVAAELAASAAAARPWLVPSGAGAVAALAEVNGALLAALTAVHSRLIPGAGGAADGAADEDVDMGAVQAPDGVEAGVAAVAAAVPPPPPRCYSPDAAVQLRLAVAGAWRALLRLHQAAADATPQPPAAPDDGGGGGGGAVAAPGLQRLLLHAGELAAAGEQLCDCALLGGAAASSPAACRMRWGCQMNPSQEAAGALQLLLQLQPPPPSGGVGVGVGGVGPVTTTPVVPLLVGKLAAVMSAAGTDGEDSDAAGTRAAALRLAVQLTQPPAGPAAAAAAGAAGAGGAFAAALLEAMPPLVLGLRGAPGDEEWLRACLDLLATQVLPAVAQQPHVPAAPEHPRTAAAAAAHQLVAAVMTSAAHWEAAGGAGLPFRRAAESSPAAAVGPAAAAASTCSLTACWCAVVQQLVACCDERQQLDAAVEAAERIAACSAALPPPLTTAAASDGRTALPWASLPLACAAVAGLRPSVLAPHSTQALADSLLHLLAAAATSAGGGGSSSSGLERAHLESSLCTAAVALAAAVNRWQDAAALEAWLGSAFRPALLQRLAPVAATAGLEAAAGVAAAAAVPPPVAVVRAVGWVGRALALRNHPGLREIVQVLLDCMDDRLVGTAAAGADADAAGVDVAAAAGAAAGAGGSAAMDVDGEAGPAGVQVLAAPPPPLEGPDQERAVAAMAAAEAFGVLVAEQAASGGVALAARPAQAMCRVLWQQRTYSLCLQSLEAGQQSRDPRVGLPLPVAVAVASLAGSAPQLMCRNDAARMAPLLLRAALALSRQLGDPAASRELIAPPGAAAAAAAGPTAWAAMQAPSWASATAGEAAKGSVPPAAAAAAAAAATAATAAAALRDALAVLRDWLTQQRAQPSAQLEKVLQEHAEDLVECVCAAAAVGAPHQAPRPPGCPPAALADAAVAVAVRELALCCCSGLLDALPYHMLHPTRQQVVSCIVRALDDNRRSVRQLAVRARRAWADK